jgi:hypothetical protein
LMVCDEKARRRMGDLARKSVERDYGVGPFLEALEDLLQCVNAA